MNTAASFFDLEPFDRFEQVVDEGVFSPVDTASVVGLSDVVDSTGAIADGRYKAVNMAGAAVISAVMNALGHRAFPFVFGGDGASFVVGRDERTAAEKALADTAAWVAAELGLGLRIALVPVADIVAAGEALNVARYAASPTASYAMFTGGGLAWAETQMKVGRYNLLASPPHARPDLTGLSCRWTPIENSRGTILSLLVQRQTNAPHAAFAAVVRAVLEALNADGDRQGHPVPKSGPRYRWPPQGFDLEARALGLTKPRWKLALETLFALLLFRTGWRVGKFDPTHYVQQSGLNTDFRKFDDGLRMTVDCSEATAQLVEALLAAAELKAIVRFGTHRQTEALMTCIVPSVMADDHLHFVDGASGGYAMAAKRMKQKIAGQA